MNDDDASIAQREQKIEEMRARVELRLQALLHGDPLDSIRKQVTELRESTLQQSQSSLVSNAIQEVEEETTTTRSIEESETRWDPSARDIHFDPSVASATTTSTAQSHEIHFDPKEPLFVERTEIQDPYGDAGSYTGTIDISTKKPHGNGRMEYYDGRIYEGDWCLIYYSPFPQPTNLISFVHVSFPFSSAFLFLGLRR